MPKYKVEQQRTVFTHSLLFEAALMAIENARGNTSGGLYNYMHGLISAAFALEAYLNFAGDSSLPFWSSIDRISAENKLQVLCVRAGITADFSKRPYQSVKELWRIRNFLAHARVQSAKDEWIQEEPTVSGRNYPLVDLEKLCSEQPATRMVQDVETVIRHLHGSLGLQEGELGSLGQGSGSVSLLLEDPQKPSS